MKRSGERSIPIPFGGVHGEAEPSNCEANPFGCTIFFVKKGCRKDLKERETLRGAKYPLREDHSWGNICVTYR